MMPPKCYTWLESCGSQLSDGKDEKLFFCILQSVGFSVTLRTDIFLYTEKLSYWTEILRYDSKLDLENIRLLSIFKRLNIWIYNFLDFAVEFIFDFRVNFFDFRVKLFGFQGDFFGFRGEFLWIFGFLVKIMIRWYTCVTESRSDFCSFQRGSVVLSDDIFIRVTERKLRGKEFPIVFKICVLPDFQSCKMSLISWIFPLCVKTSPQAKRHQPSLLNTSFTSLFQLL